MQMSLAAFKCYNVSQIVSVFFHVVTMIRHQRNKSICQKGQYGSYHREYSIITESQMSERLSDNVKTIAHAYKSTSYKSTSPLLIMFSSSLVYFWEKASSSSHQDDVSFSSSRPLAARRPPPPELATASPPRLQNKK